jgi:hypothetical protein
MNEMKTISFRMPVDPVESDQEHIFQESEEVQSEIARVLQPFCVLLGLLVQ